MLKTKQDIVKPSSSYFTSNHGRLLRPARVICVSVRSTLSLRTWQSCWNQEKSTKTNERCGLSSGLVSVSAQFYAGSIVVLLKPVVQLLSVVVVRKVNNTSLNQHPALLGEIDAVK